MKPSVLRLIALGAVLLAILDVIFLSFYPIVSFDLWWILAAGREMVRTHRPLTTDVFSCAIYGKPWLNKYMPLEILLYLLYSGSGPDGLILVRILLILVSLGFSFSAIVAWKRKGLIGDYPLLTIALLIALASILMSRRLYVGPELFGLACFSGFILLWERGHERDLSGRFWALLALNQFIWTNFHGSFFLGFLIAGIYLIERAIRRKGILKTELFGYLLLVSVTFVNPYGWNLHRAVLRVMSTPQYSKFLMEWFPLFHPFDTYVLRWWAIGAAGVSGAGFWMNRRRLRLSHCLLLLIFLLMTLKSRRHLVFFSLTAVVANLWNYGQIFDRWRKKIGSFGYTIAAAGGVWAFLIIFNYRIVSGEYIHPSQAKRPFGFGILKSLYPWYEAEFMERTGVKGNLFCRYNCGGFIIWRLTPQVKPFLDGRAEPFPIELMERYWNILIGEESPDAVCREFQMTLALIDHEDEHLLRHFRSSPEWGLCYIGYTAALFLKRTEENAPILAEYEIPSATHLGEKDLQRLRFPSPGEMLRFFPYSDYREMFLIRLKMLEGLGLIDREKMDEKEVISRFFP